MTTKKAIAKSDSVKAQLATDAFRIAQLETDKAKLEEENTLLRKQNVELASVIENDLKADLKTRIMAKTDFKDSELQGMKLDQLQQIDATLQKTKPVDLATYKSIRAGAASTGRSGLMTVGSLHGKSRKEILDMGGEF